MTGLKFLLVLVLSVLAVLSFSSDSCCAACDADESEPWSYRGSNNGPSEWGRLFPRDCNGQSQSPINIDKDSSEEGEDLPPLRLRNYREPISKATMVNNGHTVQIMPEDNVRRTIVVDDVEYALAQFHFHWGTNSNEGSEHTINEKAYAMEVHFVHLADDGRVAVVGVFFRESRDNNDGLTPIVDSLSDVMYRGDRTNLKRRLVLNKLLPKNPASFFRYQGSLTTPNCTEGVTWSVIPKPIPVGRSQMRKFRRLFSVTKAEASERDNRDCLIAPNFRPVQPLNGRKVYYSQTN